MGSGRGPAMGRHERKSIGRKKGLCRRSAARLEHELLWHEWADASVDDGIGRADDNNDKTRQRGRRYSRRRMHSMDDADDDGDDDDNGADDGEE